MTLTIGPVPFDDPAPALARSSGVRAVHVFRPAGPLVVLGAGSRVELELNAEACEADGVPVCRRAAGGCAVVVDPGNVILSIAYPAAGFGGIRAHFDAVSRFVIEGLAAVGIGGVRVEGSSDLVLDDRKIAGAAIHRTRDLLHYGACLLVDPDLALLPRYLAHPPREPAYRRGRAHLDFVRALAEHPGGWTAPRLEAALGEALEPAKLVIPKG